MPGFSFSVFSYVVSLLRPEIIRELELPKHGLEILPLDGTITPLDDDYLWRVNDHGKTVRELRRWSLNDAEAYEEYGPLMAEMARFIKPILSIVPPDPGKISIRDWLPLGPLAKTFKDLPKRLQTTFIQLMTMSAADFLDQWFETEPLKATMSASGIIGTFQGPRSPGTAYVLLHHYMGEIDGAFRAWGVPRGGTGTHLRRDRERRARRWAWRSAPRRRVARIDVRGGRATGVTLEPARRSKPTSCCPRWTRAGRSSSCSRTASWTRRSATRSSATSTAARRGKVNLALDGLPELACKPGAGEWLRGAISFSPVARLHGARLRRREVRPSVASARTSTASCPTLVDPTMAPPGKHVMSCFVQYAPYHLENGEQWDDAKREAFGQNVIDTLEERFPNIRNLIEGHQFVTPKDIEDITGLTEGNIFPGELSLEQLFFNRPVPGWARYETPVRDLWMCGSATHPGGGIMGAPGMIAAREYLKQRKRGRRAA